MSKHYPFHYKRAPSKNDLYCDAARETLSRLRARRTILGRIVQWMRALVR